MDRLKLHAPPPRTDAPGNHLLHALLREDRSLLGALEAVSFPTGHEIYRQNGSLLHVYFPVSGVLSLVVRMRSGKGAEVATVGNEGFVGLPSFGTDFVPHSVVQQAPGECLRLSAARFADSVRRHPAMQSIAHAYGAYLLRLTQQSAACTALHPLIARACRWLLVAHDRAGGREFFLTHAMLAESLGVRRPSASEVAARLAQVGLIEYSRGMVKVKDRRKLEAATCECYGVTQTYYQRLLGRVAPVRAGRPDRIPSTETLEKKEFVPTLATSPRAR